MPKSVNRLPQSGSFIYDSLCLILAGATEFSGTHKVYNLSYLALTEKACDPYAGSSEVLLAKWWREKKGLCLQSIIPESKRSENKK